MQVPILNLNRSKTIEYLLYHIQRVENSLNFNIEIDILLYEVV